MWLILQLITSSMVWCILSLIKVSENNSSENIQTKSFNISSSLANYEEFILVNQFRTLMKNDLKNDYENSDQFLVRWLRARSMNLNEAKKMLIQAKTWRKANNMDSILNETHLKMYPLMCFVHGIDNDGAPVLYYRISGLDLRRALFSGLRRNITRQFHQCLERARVKLWELTVSTGKDYSQAIGIMDAEGSNLMQHACFNCMALAIQIIQECELSLPGYVKLIVVVNAPSAIKPFIDILLTFMSSTTLKAVKYFGVDKQAWSSFILKYIPRDQLLTQYGGTSLLNF